MAIFKVNKTKDYTVMSNLHLREKSMSLKAKGLLSMMLSLPENWDYSINGLVAICKENESAINSTLKELKEFGYLKIEKLMPNQTKSGRIEYIYNIYEVANAKQEHKKQGVENQGLEFQGVENQRQLNTNNKIINELNINNIIDIVDYLNENAGTNYKSKSAKTQTLIKARLNEGFTVEDFKKVIDNKVREWKRTEWEKYLRPETLFGTKFESYLNQKRVKKIENEREYTKEEIKGLFSDIENIEF